MVIASNYVSSAGAVDYTASGAKTAGDVVVQDKLVGIAKIDIANGDLGALATQGIFDVPRGEATAFAAGQEVYWDENGVPEGSAALTGAAVDTSAAGTNKFMGLAVAAAADSATVLTVRVQLSPGFARDTIALGDISDVDVGTPTDKQILVANGTKWNSVAMSGLTAISNAGAVSLPVMGDAGGGIPLVYQKTFGDDATGDVVFFNANAPFKMRIIQVWVENRAANGANANTIQLCKSAAGADTITDAMALTGKVDTDIINAINIDDANGLVAAAGSLYIRQTKAGGTMGGNVYIMAIPVA